MIGFAARKFKPVPFSPNSDVVVEAAGGRGFAGEKGTGTNFRGEWDGVIGFAARKFKPVPISPNSDFPVRWLLTYAIDTLPPRRRRGCLAAMMLSSWSTNSGTRPASTTPGRGEKLATIPVGKKPHELVLSEDRRTAYVTNYGADTYTELEPGDNTISVIDLAARRKMDDIDLGKYHRPHGIERGKSGRLYVTTDFPAAVLMIDPRPAQGGPRVPARRDAAAHARRHPR